MLYTHLVFDVYTHARKADVWNVKSEPERCSNSNRKRAKTPKDPRAPTARDVIHSLELIPKMG